MSGSPITVGKDRVSIRILLSMVDYEVLRKIANQERNEMSTLVRRAIAHFYLVPNENDAKPGDESHDQR